ncbi:PhoX family protein [Actinomycetospora soli]|uniref:PhoX family protein n=1 Tax=Actinomycetospora soli TaxID=2893887 RepID=UPI001E495C53|nr:PhoX family phosphatase [Actinomycetospora soli]MCD2188845.1 PhoX family phosphatase [Actinomycetospora soli]
MNRRLLPLLTRTDHRRSATHCRYKCGDACDAPVRNRSDNPTFREVVSGTLSRRSVLSAGLVVGATGALAACGGGGPAPTAAATPSPSAPVPPSPGLGFTAVAPNTADAVTVPEGYAQQVLIRWGDPVVTGAPTFDVANQTAERQAQQFGFNNDFLAVIPIPGDTTRALLVANHEYTTEPFMHPAYVAEAPTPEQIRIGMAAHGMSVVAVALDPSSGRPTSVLQDPLNRRVTATTPFTLTGPVAGDPLVRTAADPEGRTVLGTLNNCAGGTTPWSTVLSGEENIDQYFANGAAVADPVLKARYERLGLDGEASERRWETVDPRFDLLREPNEAHRFGWVVELDPFDPAAAPRKHTALGRFKHEGATVRVLPDGTTVAYMGDDERFEYAYKFVSSAKARPGTAPADRAFNQTLLDQGTLYVATFTGEARPDGGSGGRGEWRPLVESRPDGTARSFVPGFSGTEVLLFTRQAADVVGATKMDRPEDVEPHPVTGAVYMALTNNDERGVEPGAAGPDAANPRPANTNGQVLELVEDRSDPTATTFAWSLLLVCGDPKAADTYYGGFPKDQVSAISCPDNLAFDPTHGHLWVSTDGNALDANDGLFAVSLAGADRGRVKQFLTVPRGAETCGPVIMANCAMVCVQHPGEVDDASLDRPASHWPDGGTSPARPAVVVVWRSDGGGFAS